MWFEIEPLLNRLHSAPITEEEKAFGITHRKSTTGIILRNWVTYSLRKLVMQIEKEAYYAPSKADVERSKTLFNQGMALQVKKKLIRYKSENNLDFFDNTITHAGVLCEKIRDGEYRFKKVFN